jgi:O-antigen ligase
MPAWFIRRGFSRMRRVSWGLLVLLAFTVPWEYSLDLGEPWGNISRIINLLLLLAVIPAVLQDSRLRTPGPLQWMVLVFYLWFCFSYFWTIDPLATQAKLRSNFQEMVLVWLVWELTENASDLRALMRAYVAGSWVLALFNVADLISAQAMAADQTRFVATGQDPNDVARFLDLGFPLAALLLNSESRWPWRLLAAGYLPLGLFAVLLTASRGGFIAAVVGLVGCSFLLMRNHPRRLLASALALPLVAASLWFVVPHGTLQRLATIYEQLQSGDLNQRMNIWIAGWHAFVRAPYFGTGAGTFVAAAGVAPIDTAHNTALSIAVNGGLVALFLAVAIVALAVWSIARIQGPLQWALAVVLVVWIVTSLEGTVEESRSTWLLMAMIAVAGRVAVQQPNALAASFPD